MQITPESARQLAELGVKAHHMKLSSWGFTEGRLELDLTASRPVGDLEVVIECGDKHGNVQQTVKARKALAAGELWKMRTYANGVYHTCKVASVSTK
jgi:hypothetical protein